MVSTMPTNKKGAGTAGEEFRATSPLWTIPRLEHDGLVLSECPAILTYLGETFNWKLWPQDRVSKAKVNQYLHWQHTNTRLISTTLFAPVVRRDKKFVPEVLEQQKAAIPGALGIVELWLGQHKWLCSDEPTVADLSLYGEVGQCLDKYCGLFGLHGIDMNEYPNLQKWAVACASLPGYEESHQPLKEASPRIRKAAERMIK